MQATLENMRRFYRAGVFAWSPETAEEYSADPRDYFMLSDDVVLRDDDGNAMVLAYRVAEIVEMGANGEVDTLLMI
jgi:hypothetical protein